MTGVRKNVRFLTENWPYFGNGEKYDQSYYQSLIGNGISLSDEIKKLSTLDDFQIH